MSKRHFPQRLRPSFFASSRALVRALLPCTLLLGSAVGCDQGTPHEAPAPAPQAGGPTGSGVGQVSLSLTLNGGLRFNAVSYVISGNGLRRTGSIDVSGSPSVSAVVESIPFGRGYLATLSAQDLDHVVSSCDGTSTFDVTGSAATPVAVHLLCKQAAAEAGPAAAPLPPGTKYLLAIGLGLAGLSVMRRRGRSLPG